MAETTWRLADHGDSFEREWARHVLDGLPAYEDFWRRHVVPLSFRCLDPDNYFLRPSLPSRLVDLANAGYAVFYHLAHVYAYLEKLGLRSDYRAFPRPTECLYCFFTHARSAHDALLYLCRAVNTVLKHHGRPRVFELVEGTSHRLYPVRLRYCDGGRPGLPLPDMDEYATLTNLLSSYRNLLVHKKPIFLQSDWLPRADRTEEYAGLTAIGKIAKNPGGWQADYVPVDEALEEILTRLSAVAQDLIRFATAHLDALLDTAYAKDQAKVARGDHRLTLKDFRRARGA